MELPPPRDNQFLFLDMNSFFASCEQHRYPELRGKPVGVTPVVAPTGCILAASYAAKNQGVKTGTLVRDALRRVPDMAILPAQPAYYVEIHNQIAHLLQQEITPYPIRLSVDEFAIALDQFEQPTLAAHALAKKIKQRLAEVLSPALTCSIGIGPNIFLAKLGTEIQKPDGLVMIQLHTLSQAYTTLKLRDIPGINRGMDTRLHSLGIRSPLEFFQAPRKLLHQAFGISGDAWWYNLHGYKVNHAPTPTKSMSHSHVLAPALRTKVKGRAVLYKLWLKVAERLRAKQLTTCLVVVAIREIHHRWVYELPLRPTQNPLTVFRTIAHLYDTQLPATAQPIKMTVVALDLAHNNAYRLNLFPEDSPKVDTLFHVIDTLNASFGRWTVKPASLLPIHDSAPNRIAFRAPDYAMD